MVNNVHTAYIVGLFFEVNWKEHSQVDWGHKEMLLFFSFVPSPAPLRQVAL